MKSKLLWAAFLLSFLGFLDAAYLTIIHYKNVIPPCSIAHGCETVLTSQYATIGPIPIALLGVFFYLGVLGLLGMLGNGVKIIPIGNWLRFNRSWKLEIGYLTFILTGLGALTAIALIAIQAFVLHAYCQYCLSSEAIDFLLLGCVWSLWRKNK